MKSELKEKILVVDDSHANVELLVGILSTEYDVAVALDGERALKIAPRIRPALILLDIKLPGIDGYEVCRLLRDGESTADIPIIFITADNDKGSEGRGLRTGAVDYIAKPIDPELVKQRIRTQIELRRHRDHLSALVDERTRQLTQTLNVMIATLGALAEYRDTETGEHIVRTQRTVELLARQLSDHPLWRNVLGEREIAYMVTAAPMHDLGKVAIPDQILRKPGRLDEAETMEMRKHAQVGYQVLQAASEKLDDSALVEVAARIAWCHHEKWDGSGYPRGLRGNEIPPEARLMAVADVYDALISERVYKAAMSHEQACRIIEEGSGTHFDPVVVEAFRAISPSLQKGTTRIP